MISRTTTLALAAAAASIAAVMVSPLAMGAESLPASKNRIERGRYLVKIAGCNDCHTAGYAERAGNVPESTWLTGSPLGYRGPWGTTYASNLRPHFQAMSADQWVLYAKAVQTRPPMPWFVLHDMSDADLRAMHAFVKSLGPASGHPQTYLPAGQDPKPPFVTFPAPPSR